ncbi:MAG TPA: HD domain-containing phosphohydrolase [Holophagaceae bacterium]|nr:HD domain-containing phosphohydrolase [Holophagaceae bacterium]
MEVWRPTVEERVQERADSLEMLGRAVSLQEKLEGIHATLRRRHPFVDRVALALYDPPTGLLRTFAHSSGGERPLDHYESSLREAPGLRTLVYSGKARVVNDLSVFGQGQHVHTRRLAEAGYLASYTLPIFFEGHFAAFVFFNSRLRGCFTPAVVEDLDTYGHLLGAMLTQTRGTVRTLLAVLRSVHAMIHARDPETGKHLERMGRYVRLIAQDLADRGIEDFDDVFIEHITAFAPLHDLGKVGVPDAVLRKPQKLDPEEFDVMKRHTTLGRQLIEEILAHFGLEGMEDAEVLKQVAEFHHEQLDGSGYPLGLAEDQIPIAARIVAVADIFDALTSARAYKTAWPREKAFEHLLGQADQKLDRACVEALVRHAPEVAEIQRQYADAALDEPLEAEGASDVTARITARKGTG